MPDEGTEQTPDVTSEQESPIEEQVQPVAEGGAEPVADDEGAVAEPTFDFSTDEGILAAAEQNPTLKGLLERMKKDGENTGRQRYESEMRRRMASDESLAAGARILAERLGVAADDESVQQYVQTFTQPYQAAAHAQTALAWINGAREVLSDEGKQGIDMALSLAGDDPAQLTTIVNQLWAGYGQNAHKSGRDAFEAELRDMKPEDARKNPALLSLYERMREYETAAEERAQRTTAARASRDPGPATSRGRAPTGNRPDEIDEILRTAKPGSSEYAQAYTEKYGFAVPTR